MAEQVVSFLFTVADYCGPFLYRHSRYVIAPKSCIDDLKAAIRNLEDAERRLEHAVEDAKANGDGIEQNVHTWFLDVKKHKEEMQRLVGRRLRGLHHPVDRHKLGRDAVKGKEIIDALCQKKTELEDKVSYRIHASSSGSSSYSLTKSAMFELESRTLILNDVLKALEDENVGIIGIHGIGGVGKSTLLNAVAQCANESKKFLKVETLNVPKNPDVNKLRSEVVNLVNEAKAIADKKSDTKRMLIIMDDFWERIDLTGCVKNDGKLIVQFIFTSRFQDLLFSMNCRRNFKLDVLDPKESRLLLTKLVTDNDVFNGAKLESLSDDQLDKTCAGLPLLIDALAQIMKKSNSANPWEDALKQLPRNMDSVDTILDLSYKQLDVSVKSILSLCALSGKQNVQIQTLLGYSVGLGLFDNHYTMEAAGKKMGEWVTSLVDSSLLQNGNDNSHVKIHDVVRDFIVKYAFKRPPVLDGKESPKIEMFIFSRGKSSNDDDTGHNVEIPHEMVRDVIVKHVVESHNELDGKESLKIEIYIAPVESSRESNDHVKLAVHDFVEKLAIEGRHLLVLEGDEPTIFISQAKVCAEAPICDMESFFQGMDKLKVLHLENMYFSTRFPSSPSVEHVPYFLKELVTLCLHNCIVKDMTGIGNLKSLQVLSFYGSTVAKLLKEVGELSNLRSLDFRGCRRVEEIEPGALKGLSRLEELLFGKAFAKWESVKSGATGAPHRQRNASLAELSSMSYLATLDITIPDPITMLPPHLPFTQLQTYNLCFGPGPYRSDNNTDGQLLPSRIMKFNIESTRVLFNGWFQATLQRTQQLHLDGLNDDTNRSSIHELCIGGFKELKHLEVKNSSSTSYIIVSTEWFPCSGFSFLEFLSLSGMVNLEKIGQGLLSPESFGRLKVVKINNCDSLKSLFCLSSIHGLSQLENIQVSKCAVMEAVVVHGDQIIENEEEEGKHDHHGLVTAKKNNRLLKCLPAGKLKIGKSKTSTENNTVSAATDNKTVQKISRKVVTEDGEIIMHSLRHLTLRGLSNFSTFFTNIHSLPTTLFCDNQVSLPKLRSLTLNSLGKLKEIWQVTKSPMDLDNLESLVVINCSNLLNIFHPSLFEKKLHKLESLKVTNCQLIQKVFDLEQLVSASGKRHTILPQLKVLELTNLENLKYIISNKYPRELLGFQNLTLLDVTECGELEYLFTSTMAEAVKKLAVIKVKDCRKMKAIVKEDEDEHVGHGASRIEFPDLKVLSIEGCPVEGFSIHRNKQEVTDKDTSPPATASSFFNKKVHLPSLVDLRLYSVRKVTTIWPDETPVGYFSKLECFKIQSCEELTAAFPATMSEHLREVEIRNCCSLKTLFEINSLNTKKLCKPVMFCHLKEVTLAMLPKLEHVFVKDPRVLVSFPSLMRISVSYCGMLRDVMPSSTAATLSKLEVLTLHNCSIEEVVRGGGPDHKNQMDNIVFPLLSSLELGNLDNLIYFSSASYQLDFPSLTKLSIQNCMMMKIFSPVATFEIFGSADAPKYLFNEKVGLPKLEELRIQEMQLKELWSTEPFAGSFCQLKLLRVEWCGGLENIIPSFMLQRLQNLETLIVRECRSLQHIVVGADETSIAFPYLAYLDLETVEKLSSFSQQRMAIELPSLNDLSIEGCHYVDAIAAVLISDDGTVKDSNCSSKNQIQRPLFWFDGEISMPSLEKLNLLGMDELSMLCYGHVSSNGLSKLSDISVRKCNNLDTLFHLNMLQSLTNLEGLNIASCESLQVIYDLHLLDLDKKSDDILVVAASSIYLYNLPMLKHVWRGVHDDPKADGIILNFEKLTSFEVYECGLSYIFPASTARSLSQLKSLKIYYCGFEEIIGETKDTSSSKFIFPELDTLYLDNLANLKSFCGGMYTVELPSLSDLRIRNCSSLQVCASTFQQDESGSDPLQRPLFFVHKDSFPLLKKLIISDCSYKLRRIWEHGRHSTACPLINLTELQLIGCRHLEETLFPADTLEIFINLEKLHLRGCDSLKVIYDVKSAHKTAKLKKLHLESLPVLEHIWDGDPKENLGCFQRLTSVRVTNCASLEYLFPASVARDLLCLHELIPSKCEKLKQIIALDPKEASREGPPKFLFPRVNSLELSDLPELKCLYPGPHFSRWPLLENLIISNCMSIENPVTDSATPRQDQTKFRLLKTLTLVWNGGIESKWSGQSFDPELFPKLQVVNLKGYYSEPLHLPSSSFVHKLQTEKLTVSNASCEVLFQRDGPADDEEQVPKVAHFTKLELNSLSELKNIWEENFKPASMFINLESLQVSECAELIKVLPSSISFSSLTSLVVSNCHTMKAVKTLAAAKSLTQLSKMSVSGCDALVQIVATDDDGSNDEIAFNQLKCLKLSYLKRLTCFCSGKLYFPVLQELVVEKCPLVRNFSQQALSTPNLNRMQTEQGSVLFARDNLNTTLGQLFHEQLASLETLDMSQSPAWRKRWRINEHLPPRSFSELKTLIIGEEEEDGDRELLSTAIPLDKALLLTNLESLKVQNCDALQHVFDSALSGTRRKTIVCCCSTHLPAAAASKKRIDGIIFKNLRSITIQDCDSLTYVLTTAMVLNLTQLRDFHISGCPMLEAIVQEDTRKDTTAIEFPNLETITLYDLPGLKRFCQLGYHSALNCPSLKKISMRQCQQMKTFASELPGVADERSISDNGIILEHFFCAKVQFPNLENLILSNVNGFSILFQGTTTLGNLKGLDISRCLKLKYLFPSSVATTLVKLNVLKIEDCGVLEEIVANKGSENAATSNNVVILERLRLVFPEITNLMLSSLPELKSFCDVGVVVHTSEWPNLKVLTVSWCPKIKTLFLDIESCKNNLLGEAQDQGRHLDQIRTNQPLLLIGKDDAFPELVEMNIHGMYNMKGIWQVVDDKIDIDNNMAEDGGVCFWKLEVMLLFDLPRLESFSSACCTFSFPSLKKVMIRGCPDMKTFSAGNLLTSERWNDEIQYMIQLNSQEYHNNE